MGLDFFFKFKENALVNSIKNPDISTNVLGSLVGLSWVYFYFFKDFSFLKKGKVLFEKKLSFFMGAVLLLGIGFAVGTGSHLITNGFFFTPIFRVESFTYLFYFMCILRVLKKEGSLLVLFFLILIASLILVGEIILLKTRGLLIQSIALILKGSR